MEVDWESYINFPEDIILINFFSESVEGTELENIIPPNNFLEEPIEPPINSPIEPFIESLIEPLTELVFRTNQFVIWCDPDCSRIRKTATRPID
uniref:Uncharacterized protein n=1 Tax=Rhizophagus irregularis (strain DAOM 181602 / DAOM 197198 / MUCL 43194) TaxID=747089 RepID=U9T832_RHIID